MACDNLCGFKKNGWHDTACPESDDSISRDDRETIETLHAALLEIAEIDVNDNSDPESMSMALNKIRLIARTALQEGN